MWYCNEKVEGERGQESLDRVLRSNLMVKAGKCAMCMLCTVLRIDTGLCTHCRSVSFALCILVFKHQALHGKSMNVLSFINALNIG